MDAAIGLLDSIAPSQILQLGYTLSALAILTGAIIPDLRSRFIAYGLRASKDSPLYSRPGRPVEIKKPRSPIQDGKTCLPPGPVGSLLNYIATLQVPHVYFLHFYIALILSLAFWLYEHATHGKLLQHLCQRQIDLSPSSSMTKTQIALTFGLTLTQGIRRLLECLFLTKPSSSSRMWIGHYLVGILFYLTLSISIFIHGAPYLLLHQPDITSLTQMTPPSPRTFIAVPLFLVASGIQHDCHAYLASLPKYTLPQHPIFQVFICPHYVAECIIYVSLAVISAPQGKWVNPTLMAACGFVCVNLGITARETKGWYEERFGRDGVRGRWIAVPLVW